MDKYVLGIDIGGTNFRIGLVSKKGDLLDFEIKPSKNLNQGDAVLNLVKEIKDFISAFTRMDMVEAISIGFPSSVSKDKSTVFSTPNLSGFDNINLKKPLEEEFKIPVFIDRDVNFLLQNDIKKLELNINQTILGFYIGTGFGNAIYIDGKFYDGKNGVAGELGHIPLYGVEDECTCGNRGCLETRCSGRYLQILQEKFFPETQIDQIFENHSDDEIIKKYIRDLAIPIATEINILDPDVVILAGGVVIMKNFPKDYLCKAIKLHARKPYPAENIRLIFTEHTQQSGVVGGAQFAIKKISK